MSEANVLVAPNPKNCLDYMLVWSLAQGYAQMAPEEAFPLLEDAVFRLNDTIAAAVKVAEFIDVQGDFVIDREVQLGAFGGAMTRGAVSVVGNSDGVVRKLAEADFERMKGLVQKFEQPEVRVLARFLVLRSLLLKDGKKDIGLIN